MASNAPTPADDPDSGDTTPPLPGHASPDDTAPIGPPPTFARQLVQLFVIPALIVLVAVAIIVPIARLASSRDSIDAQLRILTGGSLEKDRWAAAHRVTTMLPAIKDAQQRAEVHAQLVRSLNETPADSKEPLRAFLILAIGHLGHPGGLKDVLSHADAARPETRQSVAQAVLNWPHNDEARQAIPTLTRLSADADLRTRVLAVQTLGLIVQPGDAAAIEALEAARRDNRADRDVVWNASVALAKLGQPEGSRLVAHLLLDRQALAQVTDVLDDGAPTGAMLTPDQQTQVILRTLTHATAMTDAAVWDKIRFLAAEDPDGTVRTRARALLSRHAAAEQARPPTADE